MDSTTPDPPQHSIEAIELRLLRGFVATAEELHFGRAAARLHLSQPALSRQIGQLERQLGCSLLDRSTHHVELTTAGETLLEHTHVVLANVDRAVHAARAADGRRHPRLMRLLAPLLAAAEDGRDLSELRAAFEVLLATQPIPEQAEIRAVNTAGVPSLMVTDTPPRPRILLHLHGGGGIMGSAYGYRALAAALSRTTARGVLVPDYRLGPEHPWSAALDDAVRAYTWLLAAGILPGDIALSGDGAGAHLALDLLRGLYDRALAPPDRVVLMEPWLDSPAAPVGRTSSPLHTVRASMAHHLRAERGTRPTHRSFDHREWPPVLVQCGADHGTGSVVRRLVDTARAAGRPVRLERYPATVSPLHLFWDHLPEAAQALDRVAAFLAHEDVPGHAPAAPAPGIARAGTGHDGGTARAAVGA